MDVENVVGNSWSDFDSSALPEHDAADRKEHGGVSTMRVATSTVDCLLELGGLRTGRTEVFLALFYLRFRLRCEFVVSFSSLRVRPLVSNAMLKGRRVVK